MKVLILNGSPRETGVTSTILTLIRETFSAAHAIEYFDAYKLNMKPCYGCFKCRPDKTCALPYDDAHLMAEKIQLADLLIIGSPTYWGNIPGPLKILFDRNVPTFELVGVGPQPVPQLKGKRAIIVVTSFTPYPYNQLASQSRGTVRALKTILESGGIEIIKTLNIPESYNFEKKKQRYLREVKRISQLI